MHHQPSELSHVVFLTCLDLYHKSPGGFRRASVQIQDLNKVIQSVTSSTEPLLCPYCISWRRPDGLFTSGLFRTSPRRLFYLFDLRAGLVFKAHRLWFNSTLGSRVIHNKKRRFRGLEFGVQGLGSRI